MNRSTKFDVQSIPLLMLTSLVSPFVLANEPLSEEMFDLTDLTVTSILILLTFSASFLLCVKKLITDRNKLKDQLIRLRDKHDELLDQKHQWQDRETEILNTNLELDKRLTARTETVNKVNHELTHAIEKLHLQEQTLASLSTALAWSKDRILIIDKHYRVCYASNSFLRFSGLSHHEIHNQPLKRLEKYICLPEMASNGLTLNLDGLIDTHLKCLDKQGMTHALDARIALSWSELKEILHYVIILEDAETEISEPI